ncbi:MAG TPA: PAS domain S-box protein, partial [Verrucomicrobiae bacterium]|nr:PAS domain S-box protein [Verrucomicrobiae bacterium]
MRNRQTCEVPKGAAQAVKHTLARPLASANDLASVSLGLPFCIGPLGGYLNGAWDTRATDTATGIFLISMATVVLWLTTRLGKGLQHRAVFAAMGIVYAACGFARLAILFDATQNWPKWLSSSVLVFLPLGLLLLSLFMFSSIPPLLEVLRASDEVQSLRGQAKFRAVVQAVPMAVVGTDCEGRITSWNPAAEQIFGYPEKEILGTLGLTHPQDTLEEQAGLLQSTLQGQVTKGFETYRVNRSGQQFPVSISTAPLRDDNGKQMGIMATIEDISERKRIEQELNDKTVTLAVVTDALNSYLESGNWGIASKKLLSHALKQTRSKCGLLGVVLDTPNVRILAHEGAIWDPEINRQLYEAKLSQQAAQGFFDLEHRGNLFGEIIREGKIVVSNEPSNDPRAGRMPPGHQQLVSLLGVPIFKGKSVVGVIAVANRPGGYTGEESRALEAISQATGVLYENYRQELKRRQLEEQRSRLEGEFRQAQKMEVLGQLAGGIAHDFNNMLMVVSGSTELLEKSLSNGVQADRYVEQIKRTVEKAAAITRQLLAFSRKQVLEIAPIDLHEVLTDSEFMLPRLLGSDIQLTFQHQAAHSWIRADAAQLEQVIANLAINARDAMAGEGSLTISTRNTFSLPEGIAPDPDSATEAGWVVLEVSDTGSGMSEETRSHIFEPFFTTKPEGKGTGLGLPTVYGIVCQVGGHITVDSKLGEGTRFQLYFPVRNPEDQVQAHLRVRPREEAEKGLTILLADDEGSLREAIAEYLRGAGHRVLESRSAHDALELARSEAGRIDVLVTDVIMPGLRGPHLAKEVQALRPEMHVIYISGYAQNLPEAQVPRGATFLQKPFRFASLGEQLKLVPRR